jgi:hypothetical protein
MIKGDPLLLVPLAIFAGGLLLLSRQIGQGQDIAPIVQTKNDFDAAAIWDGVAPLSWGYRFEPNTGTGSKSISLRADQAINCAVLVRIYEVFRTVT